LNRSYYSCLAVVLILVLTIEMLALAYWISFPYVPSLAIFAQVDTEAFQVLALFSPAFLLIFLYSWTLTIAYSHNNRLSRRIRTFLAPVSRSIQYINF